MLNRNWRSLLSSLINRRTTGNVNNKTNFYIYIYACHVTEMVNLNSRTERRRRHEFPTFGPFVVRSFRRTGREAYSFDETRKGTCSLFVQ